MKVGRPLLLIPPLLALAAYATALDNPFTYDDFPSIVNNEFIRRLHFAWVFFAGHPTSAGFASYQFRPLVLTSFALNYAWGQVTPFGYRLVNLVLHMANSVLVAVAFRRILLAIPIVRGLTFDDRRASRAALLGAALFAVHPINSMIVLLVWKRATALATLFFLVELLCFLRLRSIGFPAERPPTRKGLLVAGLFVAQALALATKEIALVFPVLLVLIDLWPRTGPVAATRRPRSGTVIFHASLLLLTVVAAWMLFGQATKGSASPSWGRLAYLGTQLKVIWLYVAMVLAPNLLAAAYDVQPVTRVLSPALLSALVLGLLLACSLWRARREPLLALLVPWILVALAPTSVLAVLQLLVDEDRVYLAFLPIWMAAGIGVEILAAWAGGRMRRPALLLASLAVTALGMCSTYRATVWSDPVSLWLDAYEKHPASRTANTNLCAALTDESRRLPLAAAVCGKAVERFPDGVEARASLVKVLVALGRAEEAEQALREGLWRHPENLGFLRLAGHLAWSAGNNRAAIAYYRRVLAVSVSDPEVIIYLARALRATGEDAEARQLTAALDVRALADEPSIQVGLADLYRELAMRDRACAHYLPVRLRAQAAPDLARHTAPLEALCAGGHL